MSNPLLGALDAADRNLLMGLLEPLSAEVGAVLCEQGDRATTVLFIEQGEAEVYARATEEDEVLLGTVSDGGVIGELSLLESSLRSATARVTRRVSGWTLSLEVFDSLCHRGEPLALELLQGLARVQSARLRSLPGHIAVDDDDPSCAAWEAPGEGQAPSQDMLEFLKRLDFFTGFTEPDIVKMLGLMKQWDVARGQRLFQERARGESAYVIVRGAAEVARIRRGSKRQLAVLGPGTLFGMLSLIDLGPRSAMCTAKERCSLLELDAAAFDRLIDQGGQLAVRLLRSVNRELVKAVRQASGRRMVSELEFETLLPAGRE